MDAGVLDMAAQAAVIMADPTRLGFLALGVLIGLGLGVIPGLSGIVGLALVLPFTWDMDPYTALAFLMGLLAVVATSDTIPAVLFGVPGTVGAAATIMDGFPMAKQGHAGRAFGAAFTASVMGGLFGAVLLAASIPIMRPMILLMGTPDQLAFCIFGLSIAAVLAGGSPLKGLAGVCLGLMLATTGDDPQTGTLRWTFDLLYLWDGLNIIPLALGLFAIPEIADLVIMRRAIQQRDSPALIDSSSQLEGMRDALANGWLVARCGFIGAGLGAIPGIGTAVIDWVAYGHAARTEEGAAETFGTGDVRGVIASEASNNAAAGGALIPTIAFGVPGSASMSLIVAAFLIHGLVPGPEMLTTHLDVTFTLVWSVALANLLGAGICFLFANQLARIALIRISILAPVVLVFVYVGAFQGAHQWGDLLALLGFGVLGWVMKRMRWARPPLMLGFVLGEVVERYMFISYELYEWNWLGRPIVMVLLALSLYGIARQVMHRRAERRKAGPAGPVRIAFKPKAVDGGLAFNLIVLALFAYTLWISAGWEFGARLVPQLVGWFGAAFIIARIAGDLLIAPQPLGRPSVPGAAVGFHFDNVMDYGDLGRDAVARRALAYFAWCGALLAAAWTIGMLPAFGLFLILYMLFAGGESLGLTLAVSLPVWLLCYLLFHRTLHMGWPPSLLGRIYPELNSIQSLAFF